MRNLACNIGFEKDPEQSLINHIGRHVLERSAGFHNDPCDIFRINNCVVNISKVQIVDCVNIKFKTFEVSNFKLSLARNGTNVCPCTNHPIRDDHIMNSSFGLIKF